MRSFFKLYGFILPCLLLPVAYVFWSTRIENRTYLVLQILLPIFYSYIGPWWGITQRRLWSINGEFKLRWHNGLIFGSFANLILMICLLDYDFSSWSLAGLLSRSFLAGSVFALWNWLFDAFAISKGFIVCHNREGLSGKDPLIISMAYAPVIFGVQGFILSTLSITNTYISNQGSSYSYLLWTYPFQLLFYVFAPIASYSLFNRWRHGDWGLSPQTR